jgi:hypothetical protein
VVTAEEVRGVVGVNDAKVLFDDRGRCRGIVQLGGGPMLNPPMRLRAQDIEAFRAIPGYHVSTEDGMGAMVEKLRRLRAARAGR